MTEFEKCERNVKVSVTGTLSEKPRDSILRLLDKQQSDGEREKDEVFSINSLTQVWSQGCKGIKVKTEAPAATPELQSDMRI